MRTIQNVLRLLLIYCIIRLIFEVFRSLAWDKSNGGDHYNYGESFFSNSEWILVGIQVTFFLVIIILLTRWMYRSYSNLGLFTTLRQKTNMTVLSWFIPIWSWVGPFLIYSELVSGYEALLPSMNSETAALRRTFLKNWWWFTFIAAQLLWALSFGNDSYNFISNALATSFFLSANVFLLFSLSDLRNMETKVAELDNS